MKDYRKQMDDLWEKAKKLKREGDMTNDPKKIAKIAQQLREIIAKREELEKKQGTF